MLSHTRTNLIKRLTALGSAGWSLARNPSALAMVAQGVNGLAALALNISLAKVLTPPDFGLFSVGFALIFFLNGYLNAAHTTGVVVSNNGQTNEEKLAHYAVEYWGLFRSWKLGVVLAIGVAAEAFILIIRHDAISPVALAIKIIIYALLVCLTSLFVTVKDYVVRYCYAINKQGLILIPQVIGTVLFFMALICMALLRMPYVDILSIFAYGISAIVISVILANTVGLLSAIRTSLGRSAAQNNRELYNSVTRAGVMSHFVIMVRSQYYLYITPILYSISILAEINSSKIVIAGASMILPVMSQTFMSRLVDEKARGGANFRGNLSFAVKCSLIVFVLCFGALLFVALFRDVMINKKYSHIILYGSLWIVQIFGTLLRNMMEAPLFVYMGGKIQGLANLFGLAVSVAALFLLKGAGGGGVIASIFVAELAVVAIYAFKMKELVNS